MLFWVEKWAVKSLWVGRKRRQSLRLAVVGCHVTTRGIPLQGTAGQKGHSTAISLGWVTTTELIWNKGFLKAYRVDLCKLRKGITFLFLWYGVFEHLCFFPFYVQQTIGLFNYCNVNMGMSRTKQLLSVVLVRAWALGVFPRYVLHLETVDHTL